MQIMKSETKLHIFASEVSQSSRLKIHSLAAWMMPRRGVGRGG
jgi:hypothetical protein